MKYKRLYKESFDPFIEVIYQKALKTISEAAEKETGNFRVPFGAYIKSVTSRLSPYNVKTPERLKEMGFNIEEFHMTKDGNYMPNDNASIEMKNLLAHKANEAFFIGKRFKDKLLEDLKKMFPSYSISQFGDNGEYKTILPFLKTDFDRYFYFDKKLIESTEENATKKVIRLIETLMNKYPDQRVLYVPVDAYIKSIWTHNHQDIRYVEKFIDGVIEGLDKYEVKYRYGRQGIIIPQFSPEDQKKLFGGKEAFHYFIVGRKELTEDTDFISNMVLKAIRQIDKVLEHKRKSGIYKIPLDHYLSSISRNSKSPDDVVKFKNELKRHYESKGFIVKTSIWKEFNNSETDYLGSLSNWMTGKTARLALVLEK
jgi:hypothetical protein